MRFNFRLVVWPKALPHKQIVVTGVWNLSIIDHERSFDALINDLVQKHGELENITMEMKPIA